MMKQLLGSMGLGNSNRDRGGNNPHGFWAVDNKDSTSSEWRLIKMLKYGSACAKMMKVNGEEKLIKVFDVLSLSLS